VRDERVSGIGSDLDIDSSAVKRGVCDAQGASM
jgi:hypothetical protein